MPLDLRDHLVDGLSFGINSQEVFLVVDTSGREDIIKDFASLFFINRVNCHELLSISLSKHISCDKLNVFQYLKVKFIVIIEGILNRSD